MSDPNIRVSKIINLWDQAGGAADDVVCFLATHHVPGMPHDDESNAAELLFKLFDDGIGGWIVAVDVGIPDANRRTSWTHFRTIVVYGQTYEEARNGAWLQAKEVGAC